VALALTVGAIPAMLAFPIAYFFLYESPFFLALRKEYEEARKVLDGLRKLNGNPDVQTHFTPLPQSRAMTPAQERTVESDSSETWENLAIIFGSKMLFTTLVVCVLQLVGSFSYYGGMYSFPQVLPELNMTVSPAANMIIGSVAELPGYLVGILAGMYMSRKGSLSLSLLGTAVTLVVFATVAGSMRGEKAVGMSEVYLQASFLFFRGITSITSMVLPLYVCETFPTRARTLGLSVAISFARIGSISAPMAFELLSSTVGSLMIFYLIAGLNVFSAVLVYLLPFETKGKIFMEDDDETKPLQSP